MYSSVFRLYTNNILFTLILFLYFHLRIVTFVTANYSSYCTKGIFSRYVQEADMYSSVEEMLQVRHPFSKPPLFMLLATKPHFWCTNFQQVSSVFSARSADRQCFAPIFSRNKRRAKIWLPSQCVQPTANTAEYKAGDASASA